MNVIDVALEISLVTNSMFPELTLPQRDFATSAARDRRARVRDCGRKSTLDQVPTVREIRISVWQRHDNMKMVGQHDSRIDREWMLPARLHYRHTQRDDMISKNAR